MRLFALLTLLLSELAIASDICVDTAPLHFKNQVVDHICRSGVPELMNKTLVFPQGVFGPFEHEDASGGQAIILDTCNKYLQYERFGGACTSRPVCWAEYYVYMRTCGTLLATQRAHKVMKTYLGDTPISFGVLPPTLLPNGLTAEAEDELEEARAKGHSAESFLRSLERKDKKFNRKEYLADWNAILHTRGDFDGDGIEDAIVSIWFTYDRYLGYRVGMLQRTSKRGPSKWTNIYELNWQNTPPQ